MEIRESDSGTYECIAENRRGSAYSEPIAVEVVGMIPFLTLSPVVLQLNRKSVPSSQMRIAKTDKHAHLRCLTRALTVRNL